MRITIYKGYQKYMSHNFSVIELDKIKKICYDMNIKYYTISYTQKEYEEYEQLSKGNN
jgi:hypothetical protein